MSLLFAVDAGHRAIMFNRIGGVGNEVYKEGLHVRVPWFQYPIIYDIRARPNQIRSPTGSKDLQVILFCLSSHFGLIFILKYRRIGLMLCYMKFVFSDGEHWSSSVIATRPECSSKNLSDVGPELGGKDIAFDLQ